MDEKTYNAYKAKSMTGEVSDDNNPIFVFNMISSNILADIVSGKYDAKRMAHRELANRGMNEHGFWVGFKAAAWAYEERWGEKAS